jgi:hypothetical protein
MSKRSASPSPPLSPEAVAVKKQRLENGSVETYAPGLSSPTTESAPVELPEADLNEADLPEADSNEMNKGPSHKDDTEDSDKAQGRRRLYPLDPTARP